MKYIFTTIMSIVLLFANFQQLVIFSLYKINQSYITEEYCENKDTPEMECNGQCHLEKTIVETEKENDKDFSFKWKDVEVFSQEYSIKENIIVINYNTTENKNSEFTSKILNGFNPIFSPPPQA